MDGVYKVHFSIDDVSRSFRYIAENNPDSIFDLRLYGTLLRWHEKYDLKISMYCISDLEGFNIAEFPEKYSEDFKRNRDWLRFGFHASTGEPFITDNDYMSGFNNVTTKLQELGAGITDTIRLHSWIANCKQKEWLVSQGVKTIFYPNVEEYSYDQNGLFFASGLEHHVTKCWIERMNDINKETACIGDTYISCFTHEWCFDEQIQRIEKLINIYKLEGYEFI